MSPAVAEFIKVHWITLKYSVAAIVGLTLFGLGYHEGANGLRNARAEADLLAKAKHRTELQLLDTRAELTTTLKALHESLGRICLPPAAPPIPAGVHPKKRT